MSFELENIGKPAIDGVTQLALAHVRGLDSVELLTSICVVGVDLVDSRLLINPEPLLLDLGGHDPSLLSKCIRASTKCGLAQRRHLRIDIELQTRNRAME